MNMSRILNKVKCCQFYELFKQLDWIIINFGDPIKYSLHVASAVRICHQNKIIFNVSDEFFTKDCLQRLDENLDCPDKAGFVNDANSLLVYNSQKVNCLLKGKFPKKIKESKWKDLIIRFSTGIEIQIMQDCLGRDYEYYRFIEYIPHYDDDPNQYSSKHYIVYNDQGEPKIKIE